MNKNKILIIIIAAIVLILTVSALFFISKQNRQSIPQNNNANNQSDAITEPEDTSVSIIIPDEIISECNSSYFNEKNAYNNSLINCDEFDGGPVCVYYKEIYKDKEVIKKLEFKTECHACRFFGETGETNSAGITMINLGWEKKRCSYE